MNSNEQQAQRDKLIELFDTFDSCRYVEGYAEGWADSRYVFHQDGSGEIPESVEKRCETNTKKSLEARKAFRDYVEHMHDEAQGMKPSISERMESQGYIDYGDIEAIRELERKAALWDKASKPPEYTAIRYDPELTRPTRWEITRNYLEYYGDTLEEALRVLPEVKA